MDLHRGTNPSKRVLALIHKKGKLAQLRAWQKLGTGLGSELYGAPPMPHAELLLINKFLVASIHVLPPI